MSFSTLDKLTSKIWVTDVKLGDYDVRSVLICDEKKAVIWDTLSHPHDMECLLPKIEDRELIIIYSHADWDHIWGTGGLPYHQADIIGHNLCLKRFSSDVPLELKEKSVGEPIRWGAVKLVAPTRTFIKNITVNLDTFTLSLHHLPGHTPDSIVAFLPEQGILLMGDAVETPLPFISAESPLDLWIEELQRWEGDLRVQTVIPSHGAIGGREILQQNIEYLQHLKDGRDVTLPEMLTDFYYETHGNNIRNSRS